jgi:hypothetical protein
MCGLENLGLSILPSEHVAARGKSRTAMICADEFLSADHAEAEIPRDGNKAGTSGRMQAAMFTSNPRKSLIR